VSCKLSLTSFWQGSLVRLLHTAFTSSRCLFVWSLDMTANVTDIIRPPLLLSVSCVRQATVTLKTLHSYLPSLSRQHSWSVMVVSIYYISLINQALGLKPSVIFKTAYRTTMATTWVIAKYDALLNEKLIASITRKALSEKAYPDNCPLTPAVGRGWVVPTAYSRRFGAIRCSCNTLKRVIINSRTANNVTMRDQTIVFDARLAWLHEWDYGWLTYCRFGVKATKVGRTRSISRTDYNYARCIHFHRVTTLLCWSVICRLPHRWFADHCFSWVYTRRLVLLLLLVSLQYRDEVGLISPLALSLGNWQQLYL